MTARDTLLILSCLEIPQSQEYYVSKGTGWVGSEKWQFLLMFSTIYADVGWVGGSEKVQKCNIGMVPISVRLKALFWFRSNDETETQISRYFWPIP